MREFTVSPIGLVTQPNKLGVYPEGAMSVADALVMRSPGKLRPRLGVNLWSTSTVSSGATASPVVSLLALGNTWMFMAWALQADLTKVAGFGLYQGGSVAVVTVLDAQLPLPLAARCRPLIFRDRLFLMTTGGLSVLDALDGTDTTLRNAQLPQPTMFAYTTPAAGNANANPNTVVGYTAILRRKYADGYELISAPAPIFRARATVANQLTGVQVIFCNPSFPNVNGVLAGDIVEVYRTREVSSPSLGLDIDPGTTVYRCITYTLTAADLTFGNVTLFPKAAPNQIVGPELYTNPGQETLQSTRLIPRASKCIDAFKGFVFYANCTYGPEWVASFPGGIGNLALSGDSRLNGIGSRQVTTGTYTIATNQITGVSAAEMVGMSVGQTLRETTRIGPNAVRKVTALGANSITFDGAAALSTGAPADTYTSDSLTCGSVGSGTYDIRNIQDLLFSVKSDLFVAIASQTALQGEGSPLTSPNCRAYGQQVTIFSQRSYIFPTINVRGTNGQNYDPPIPLLTDPHQVFTPKTYKNLLIWSWEQQPESVSPSTYAFIGSGEIYQLAVTRDVMWIFASDGLWRFTGYGTRPSGINANFRVDLIDKTLRLAGPNAFAVLRDAVFAYTNIGLVKISDAVGVQPISRGVIGDLIPGRQWLEDYDICMAADEELDEIFLNINTGNFGGATGHADTYIWSDTYKVFTKLNALTGASNSLQQLTYNPVKRQVMYGVGQFAATSPLIYDNSGAYSAWQADFQPQYGPDPASQKVWAEIVAIFDPSAAGIVITPRFNNVAYTANALAQYSQTRDARASFGIDINVPATAAIIEPGMSGPANAVAAELRGIALRYEVVSDDLVVQ